MSEALQTAGKAAEPIVRVRDLVTHYGETQILDQVSIEVYPGEIFLIVGGSGCGKTTLLKHMIGLLRPTSGSIEHNGTDITKLDEDELARLLRDIGIAFQSSGLLNSMTVGENVALPLREHGQIDAALVDAVVRVKLGLVGMENTGHMMPGELSGGMRKRAGLARALALDPPVVYFDEPSAGLDPIMAAGLDDLILELNSLLGITFVIVSHELESIRTIAHRVCMLDQGRVQFLGTVEEAQRSDVTRVRQFFARQADESIRQRTLAE